MKIRVSFDTEVPDTVAHRQIQAWLGFALHANGSIETSNPLWDKELEAESFSVKWNEK